MRAKGGHAARRAPEPRVLEQLLRDAREFGGAQAFSLSTTLVGVDAIDVATLPEHVARLAIADADGGSQRARRPGTRADAGRGRQ
jgi:hypothetical protein